MSKPRFSFKPKLPSIDLSSDRNVLLACIGLAFVFWLILKLSQDYRLEGTVELEVVPPAGMAFTEPPPEQVLVVLRGIGWRFFYRALTSKRLELTYQLHSEQDAQLGLARIRQHLGQKLAASQLIIEEMGLNDLNLRIEPLASIRVPVRLLSSLTFAPGYEQLGDIQVQPDSIDISGPMSVLASLQACRTDSLLRYQLKSNVKTSVAVQPPLKGLTLSPSAVTVAIAIEQFTEKSLFVPLQVANMPAKDSIMVFPERVKITCRTGLSQYNNIDAKDFSVAVNLKDIALQEGKNTVPIQLTKFPKNVKSIRYTPQAAEFFIIKTAGE